MFKTFLCAQLTSKVSLNRAAPGTFLRALALPRVFLSPPSSTLGNACSAKKKNLPPSTQLVASCVAEFHPFINVLGEMTEAV